jgi:hypothetical protein
MLPRVSPQTLATIAVRIKEHPRNIPTAAKDNIQQKTEHNKEECTKNA